MKVDYCCRNDLLLSIDALDLISVYRYNSFSRASFFYKYFHRLVIFKYLETVNDDNLTAPQHISISFCISISGEVQLLLALYSHRVTSIKSRSRWYLATFPRILYRSTKIELSRPSNTASDPGGIRQSREERSRYAGRSFVQTLLETCSFGGVARVRAFDPESGYTYANR